MQACSLFCLAFVLQADWQCPRAALGDLRRTTAMARAMKPSIVGTSRGIGIWQLCPAEPLFAPWGCCTDYQRPLLESRAAAMLNDFEVRYPAGLTAETASPSRPPKVTLEPVFRDVITAPANEDSEGNEVDPRRPRGDYHGLQALGPLRPDEVEFECDGYGKARPITVDAFHWDVDLSVLDDGDDFSPFTSWIEGKRLAA
ncbi:hypothetical protein TRM7615_03652 [Falsiruegeria mediterranea M17]|uniref:Uncharacterized protein n=1 Tax=Falsiruegeria mediterranea M17 TaxID=1200281 RepID=A0A2R8CCD4_9RHOB|nr:hypothetical protein TRM7615_03652 [Falsiruegeria mediterranea M17]